MFIRDVDGKVVKLLLKHSVFERDFLKPHYFFKVSLQRLYTGEDAASTLCISVGSRSVLSRSTIPSQVSKFYSHCYNNIQKFLFGENKEVYSTRI